MDISIEKQEDFVLNYLEVGQYCIIPEYNEEDYFYIWKIVIYNFEKIAIKHEFSIELGGLITYVNDGISHSIFKNINALLSSPIYYNTTRPYIYVKSEGSLN